MQNNNLQFSARTNPSVVPPPSSKALKINNAYIGHKRPLLFNFTQLASHHRLLEYKGALRSVIKVLKVDNRKYKSGSHPLSDTW